MSQEKKGNKGNKGWIWGAAIGTIVGSVTALLFAPKSGRELRKDISDGARQVGEKTQEVAGKVSEQGAVLIDKVKQTTGEMVEDFQTWRACKSSEESVEAHVSSVAEDEDPLLLETAVIGVAEDAEQAAATEEVVEAASEEAQPVEEEEPVGETVQEAKETIEEV
ncbi:YtxH domain-containing protein [Paenibacillus aceti]|uniref:YtxH domain-containing protein n=1 Tax=Paenibacillus aceti TaxID=1820010 RepID=A0ABQ1VSQ5_9BACL|nr:YtxH domain-containing protein [Paenibacillus aceti]GGF91940.1 hypothetical protein GCM10010913_11870 [Paenibacillus aceti]